MRPGAQWQLSEKGEVVAGGAGPHAYWRIYVTGTTTGQPPRMREVQMAATEGGADQCNGGSVSADSESNPVAYPKAKAFDNNTSTSWQGNALPGWIRYNFTAAVEVVELKITCDGASWAPTEFTLEYSDDAVGWSVAATFSSSGWTSASTRTFLVV
jgi:hypothetical protein